MEEKQLLEGDKISKYCSVDQNTSSFNVFFAEVEGVEDDEKGNRVSQQQLSGANTKEEFEEIQMERSEKYKSGDVGNTNAAARG